MKKGDISYKDRLLAPNLLPLAYDREIKELTYFFKALYGYYDTDANNFLSFVNHNYTRNCKNPSLVLKIPKCKTSTFQSSFHNRAVPLWNCVCKSASPAELHSLTLFKSFFVQNLLSFISN